MDYFLTIFLSVLLIASAIFDLKSQKIPNLLTLPGMLIALGYNSTLNGLDGLLFSAGGIGAGIGLLIIPYLMGGMGAGDVKLLAGVGAWMHGKHTFFAFCVSAVVGAVIAVGMVVYRRAFKKHANQFWMILGAFSWEMPHTTVKSRYISLPSASGNDTPVPFLNSLIFSALPLLSLTLTHLNSGDLLQTW